MNSIPPLPPLPCLPEANAQRLLMLRWAADYAASARLAALEEAAVVAERAYGGRAHTYASENADHYRGQDEACEHIAAAIRALKGAKP